MLGYNDPFSSVGALDGAVYFSGLKVVRLAAPLITTQPTNLIVGVGSNATYKVAATFDVSAANTNGQWLFNGSPISGATNTTYSFTVVNSSYGAYAWQVNDGSYTVVSTNATLRPPAFTIVTSPLASIVVAAGIATNISVVVPTFAGATNYQWQFNSVNILNATNRVYSFTAGPTNYGSFKVIVNDGWNTNTSSVAVVTPPAPSIVSVTPATKAVLLGSTPTTFTVAALTFSGATNYQWLSNSVSIASATAKTLIITNVQLGNIGAIYTVRVNDGTTSITSAPPVALTVAVSPAITTPALLSATSYKLSFATETGLSYVVDYKTNLLQATWIPASTNAGTGGQVNVTNTVVGSQGYFRIRLQ
jgi:hypothetical protein